MAQDLERWSRNRLCAVQGPAAIRAIDSACIQVQEVFDRLEDIAAAKTCEQFGLKTHLTEEMKFEPAQEQIHVSRGPRTGVQFSQAKQEQLPHDLVFIFFRGKRVDKLANVGCAADAVEISAEIKIAFYCDAFRNDVPCAGPGQRGGWRG